VTLAGSPFRFAVIPWLLMLGSSVGAWLATDSDSSTDSDVRVGTSPPTTLFPIFTKNRWGFIDGSGRIVVPPRYESIVPAESERMIVARSSTQDLFMAATVEPETTAIVAVKSGGKWGFVDQTGQLLPLRFDEVGAFTEGLAPARQGLLWGFVSTLGTIAIPLQFDAVGTFVGGVAIVSRDLKYGVIDRDGRAVVRLRFEMIRPADSVFHDNRALVIAYGKKGFVGRAGTITIPPAFDEALPFSDGLAPVVRDHLTGYIDTTGRMVIRPSPWTAERFHRGRAVVQVGGKYGYIDRSGAYVARPQFDDARAFTVDDRAEAWKGPIHGFVDLSGHWSEPPIDEIQRLDDSLSVGIVAGRKGLVRRASGEMIREYRWPELGLFSEGLAHVRGSNGRLGFIDLEGQLVIPAQFLRVGRFDRGLCKATTRNTLGYIDHHGSWVWSSRFR
jgi:hypothetical protein